MHSVGGQPGSWTHTQRVGNVVNFQFDKVTDLHPSGQTMHRSDCGANTQSHTYPLVKRSSKNEERKKYSRKKAPANQQTNKYLLLACTQIGRCRSTTTEYGTAIAEAVADAAAAAAATITDL